MKIALVMAGDEEGGLEKHVMELANALALRGHAVSVLAHEKYRERLLPQVQFLAVDLARSRRSPLALFQLWKALRQSGAELVHAHGAKAASMVAFVLTWLQMRSVASIHSRKKRRRMFSRFNAVIAVSRSLAEGLDVPALHVVHNGLALPPAPDAARQQQIRAALALPDRPVVLAVGRLVPVKGFDSLISTFPGESGVLLIVGDGPERERWQALAAAHGNDADIRFLGHRDDVPDLLVVSDLLVISSRQEGGPYVLAEALQAGVPVVSTAVGVVPEVLPPSWTCPVDDAEALGGLVRRALANPDGIRQDQAGAFRYARESLSLDGMVERVEAVYGEVMA